MWATCHILSIRANFVFRSTAFISYHLLQANLKFVPDFCEYKYHDRNALVQISANPTKLRNASLAIQLSYDWMRRNSHKLKEKTIDECLNKMNSDDLNLAPRIVDALISCQWPGRCQTLHWRNITLYVDGAHTIESLKLCLDWFRAETKNRLRIIILPYICINFLIFLLNIIHLQLPQKISAVQCDGGPKCYGYAKFDQHKH